MADDPVTPKKSAHGFPVTEDPTLQDAGAYQPPSDFEEFLGKIPLIRNLVNSTGSIRINPKNTNDPALTLKHEDIHGVLNPIFESGQLANINAANPYYAAIASKISAAGFKNPQVEAPALASTGETKQIGIDDPLSQNYLNNLKQQLFKLDPNLAKAFQ